MPTPPWVTAFSIRFATIRSNRRGSVVRTTWCASSATVSEQPWLSSTPLTSAAASTGSTSAGSCPESRREISSRSSSKPTQTIDVSDEHPSHLLELRRQVLGLLRQLSCLANQRRQR